METIFSGFGTIESQCAGDDRQEMTDRYIDGDREAKEILVLITRLSALSACLTRRARLRGKVDPSLAGLTPKTLGFVDLRSCSPGVNAGCCLAAAYYYMTARSMMRTPTSSRRLSCLMHNASRPSQRPVQVWEGVGDHLDPMGPRTQQEGRGREEETIQVRPARG